MSAADDTRDEELQRVADFVRTPDASQTERRVAAVLRDTRDQLLDGVHTGRWRWEQLMKTEKTHAGTLVEINLQREFKFSDGKVLDFQIEGAEVDCKYSQDIYGWMFPPEAIDQLCLVITADFDAERWSMGIVRARREYLGAPNRDAKRQLLAANRPAVQWLFRDRELPPNVFLKLPPETVTHILDPAVSGQERVNRLFTAALGLVVGRSAVATAAQQHDYMKRVRYNGGARQTLRSRGIVIFGHEHSAFVSHLGLPAIHKGELLAAQLARTSTGVEIDGAHWRLATAGDGLEEAPLLPRAKPKKRES